MPTTTAGPLNNVVALDSSSLVSVAYDIERMILQIEFRDRTIYQYVKVPERIHQELLQAVSKGGYFNRYVRNRFISIQLNPDLVALG